MAGARRCQLIQIPAHAMSFIAHINRLLRKSPSRTTPQVAVGGFGKHPGWDDHVDDIGMSTDALVALKRWLYVEGIRRNIDSDTWEKLEPAHRINDFKHLFLWRTGQEMIVGRMWSSRDGKGRSRYPMVICVHCRGLSLEWILSNVLNTLETLEARCKETESAATVRSLIDSAQRELHSRVQTVSSVAHPPRITPSHALAILADQQQWQNNREGLHRILYQIDREMGAYRKRREAMTGTDMIALRPQHIRVPACADTPDRSIELWMALMDQQLSSSAPLLVLVPRDESWVDMIVGVPTEGQLLCVRAATAAIPMATDVPYQLNEQFIAQAERLIAESKDAKHRDGSGDISATRSGSRKIMSSLLLAVGLVVLSGAGWLFWMGLTSEPQPGEPSETQLAESARGSPEEALRSADDSAGQRRGDLHYENWGYVLNHGSPRREQFRNRCEATPGLTGIVAILDRQSNGAADDRPADQLLLDVSAELSHWLTDAREMAQQFDELRWIVASELVNDAIAPVEELLTARRTVPTGRGDGFLQRFEVAAEATTVAHALSTDWSLVQELQQAIQDAAMDDPVLSRFSEIVFVNANQADLATLREHIAILRDRAEQVHRVVMERWVSDVDIDYFTSVSQVHENVRSTGSVNWQVLAEWMAEVQRPRFDRLEPAADPRDDPQLALQMQRIRIHVNQLAAAESPDAYPADMVEQVDAIQSAFANLHAADRLSWSRQHQADIEQQAEALRDQLQHWDATLSRLVQGSIENIRQYRDALADRSLGVRSEVLEQAWQSQRDRLLEQTDPDEMIRHDAEQIDRLLISLDEQLVDGRAALREMSVAASIDVVEVRHAIERKREKVLAEAVGKVDWKEIPVNVENAFWQSWRGQCSDFELWLEDLRGLLADYAAIEDAFDLAYGLEDVPAGQVQTVAAMHERWSATAIYAEMHEALKRIDARTNALRAMQSLAVDSRDARANLVEVIASTQEPELLLAAWRNMGAYLASPVTLQQDQQVHQRVIAAVNVMQDRAGDRRTQLLREIDAERSRRWLDHLRVVNDKAAIESAFDLQDAFGVRDDQLSSAMRLNSAHYTLKRIVASATDDEVARSATETFIASARTRLPLPGEAGSSIESLIESLERLLAAGNDPVVDISSVGPGVLGWHAEVVDDGERVVFTPASAAGGRQPLEFRRLAVDGAEIYLSTEEMSLGLFKQAVTDRGEWAIVRELIGNTHRGDEDLRRGPRIWIWNGDEMAAGSHWPAGVAIAEAPSGHQPMQYVSPAAALYVARLLNCRLPSSNEWKAAVDTVGIETLVHRANLRDQAWKRQFDYVTERIARERLDRPTEGAFKPAETESSIDRGEIHQSAHGDAYDDGVVWFVPVETSDGEPGRFTNLVGNVAEFVFEHTREFEQAFADLASLSREAVMEFLTDRHVREGVGPALHVIGGSALSHPSLVLDQPHPVPVEGWFDFRQRGYADVGFRLAFPAHGWVAARMSLRDRLHAALEEQRYVSMADH